MESLHHVIMEEMESNGMTQTHDGSQYKIQRWACACAVAASALPQQRLARKIWAKQKGTGRKKTALEPCPEKRQGADQSAESAKVGVCVGVPLKTSYQFATPSLPTAAP